MNNQTYLTFTLDSLKQRDYFIAKNLIDEVQAVILKEMKVSNDQLTYNHLLNIKSNIAKLDKKEN